MADPGVTLICTVRKDRNTGEYIARLRRSVDGGPLVLIGKYFTDDKEDANASANVMLAAARDAKNIRQWPKVEE